MPRKKGKKSNLQKDIKETAWKQIAAQGAAALSLRAIARDLDITAPAIYNYFPRRDDLVTALIVDAFTSFADHLSSAIETLDPSDHALRLRALGLAYRDWAVHCPQRYHLIFGTPIPGYVAPVEITIPAASRGLSIIVNVLGQAQADGRLQWNPTAEITPGFAAMFKSWQASSAPDIDLEVLFLALVIWGHVHGLVMLEIGNQYPPYITDPGAIYHREIELSVHRYIK